MSCRYWPTARPRGLRRDFQRNPTVHAAGSVINRPEQVRCLRQILQREFEEEFLPRLAFCELAFDGVVVVVAVLDRVVESSGAFPAR